MTKLLLPVVLLALFSSCISVAHKPANTAAAGRNSTNTVLSVASHFKDADTALLVPGDLTADKTPASLLELPRTAEGAFVLAPGFYEADFKTYCLQPGTPGPSANDAYFQGPLDGPRAAIIETILRNSREKAHLNQKNVQLLLWSVVSRTQFYKLSPEVQSTAFQLITSKQVFELNGGVLGVARAATKMLPSSGVQNSLQQLFDLGTTSYEAYERLAVLSIPAPVSRPQFKRGQWYLRPEGYYVRYLPDSYKQTRIQVYVPESAVDSAAQEGEAYIIFDPASMVLVPANSNAQRLGVGGAVGDIAGKVIDIITSPKESQRPKDPRGGRAPQKVPDSGKTPPKAPGDGKDNGSKM